MTSTIEIVRVESVAVWLTALGGAERIAGALVTANAHGEPQTGSGGGGETEGRDAKRTA